MHRKELYKSTNTGRLIADLFPDSCSAYLWSRTEPEPQLLAEIANQGRRCVLLFPEANDNITPATQHHDSRPLTVIVLDGTWKQAARMANLSPYLQALPRLLIQPEALLSATEQGYIRKAQHEHQLSTAEAAACVLRQQGELENATLLEQYFSVFNQHCIATRRNITPMLTPAHHALEQAKHHDTRN